MVAGKKLNKSQQGRSADSVVVLDFETTGLYPNQGDRAIEIGAVRINQGAVVERFQQLMNPGQRINSFIESYTGISNKMLQSAPPCEEVMEQFVEFIGGDNIVAHNASFDQRFLDAELQRINAGYQGLFACSMLISRRLYQEAPNHKLASLVAYKNIATDGVFHRALADAEMTASLWQAMLFDIADRYEVCEPSFVQMQKLSKLPKTRVELFFSKG